MKKVFALAIVLGLAACAPKENAAPAADTTTMTAPAAADSMAQPDTMKMDSTAAAPAAH
jgi:hypothetical protein